MTYEEQIRKLARSVYYQNLYSASKEINSISLFDNTHNYSGLQVLFIYWLQIYSMLYDELSQEKWKWLDQIVIDNDTRCDAFLYWRKKQLEAEMKKYKNENKVHNSKLKNKDNVTSYSVDLQ